MPRWHYAGATDNSLLYLHFLGGKEAEAKSAHSGLVEPFPLGFRRLSLVSERGFAARAALASQLRWLAPAYGLPSFDRLA